MCGLNRLSQSKISFDGVALIDVPCNEWLPVIDRRNKDCLSRCTLVFQTPHLKEAEVDAKPTCFLDAHYEACCMTPVGKSQDQQRCSVNNDCDDNGALVFLAAPATAPSRRSSTCPFHFHSSIPTVLASRTTPTTARPLLLLFLRMAQGWVEEGKKGSSGAVSFFDGLRVV